jgi:hypothetical protein
MARYFFLVKEYDGTTTPDEEGMELPDDATAIDHAHEFARDLAADFVKDRQLIDRQRIEVTKHGTHVTFVYLRHEVRIAPTR